MSFAPICVRCEREMLCKKNDYLFGDYDNAAIWAGDMYECEGCKAQVIVGVAREPLPADYAKGNFHLRRDAT